MPASPAAALRRGVYLAQYRLAGRPVLIAVGREGELLAHRAVPAEWPVDRAIGALAAWLDTRDPAPTLRLVSADPIVARQVTRPVLPPERCVSRAHWEILHGWRTRGGKAPRRR